MPIEFGGGIRSREDVQQLCDAGVARVVLGLLPLNRRTHLRELVDRFGRKDLCWYRCARWSSDDARMGNRDPDRAGNLARSVAGCGVKRIIYTDIARDGMLTGPNIEQTVAVARAANVHVTASGGVSSLDDIKRLRDAGEPLLDSVIVGKALYEGKFKLEDAINL